MLKPSALTSSGCQKWKDAMSQDSPIDRRIKRTKAAIREAMAACVNEAGFDDLSVKDITRRAGINRGTFYLHYHDKTDLVRQIQDEIILDVEQIILNSAPSSLAELSASAAPLPVLVRLFNYLKGDAALINAMLMQPGCGGFHEKIRCALERNLRDIGFFAGAEPSRFQVPARYLISYVLSAHLGVLQEWLQSGCQESPEEMARILSTLSLDGPVRAMAPD